MFRVVIAIAFFGMIAVFWQMRLHPTGIQIVYEGSSIGGASMEVGEFEVCDGSFENGMWRPDPDCADDWQNYAEELESDKPRDCEYAFAFRSDGSSIKAVRVDFVLSKQGEVLARRNIQVSAFDAAAKDDRVAKTVKARCDADHAEVVAAVAMVNGQSTDLIAAGAIHAREIVPFIPAVFIGIADE